ncbi:MAG: helix-turn-helix transcriptional regulator [Sporolactobacillus sp.]
MKRRIGEPPIYTGTKKNWETYVHEKEMNNKGQPRSALANFCSQFKCLRKNLQCTQEEIASQLGLSKSVISRIETGNYAITLSLLLKLSSALSFTIIVSNGEINIYSGAGNTDER